MNDDKSNGKGADWASPRLRGIIEKAKSRKRVFKEIDLGEFDGDLAGQLVEVWANAPSVLARHIGELAPGDAAFVSGMSEYLYRTSGESYTAADLQDLLDAWPGALRPWFVGQLFSKLTEYNQERADFFASSGKVGQSAMPSTSERSK